MTSKRIALFIIFIVALTSHSACSGGGNPLSPEPDSIPFQDVEGEGVYFDGIPIGDSMSGLSTSPGTVHLISFIPPEGTEGKDFRISCTSGTWILNGTIVGPILTTRETALEWRAPDTEGEIQIVIEPVDQGFDCALGFNMVVDARPPFAYNGQPTPVNRESTFVHPMSGETVVAAEGELLVKLAPGESLTEIMSLRSAQDYSVLQRLNIHQSLFRLRMDPDVDFLSAWFELRDDPRVETVEFNYMAYPVAIPDDPDYGKKHEFPKINASEAWDIETGSPDVWVAVIDTGVDRNHPDLAGNVVNGADFILGGDGLGGETEGDGVDQNNDGIPDQNVGHGTHVAGIIAAQGDNGEGACGIAYNASILPLRIFPANGDTGATFSSIIEAVNYAASEENVRVISMSIGTTYESSLLQAAIDDAWDAGKVLVAAAANSNTDSKYFPAAHDNVIAVAAINKSDEKASFSNYGPWVDVSAYGTGIYSTYFDDSYAYMSGTSMACPLVSGCFALLFSYEPSLTNDQAVSIMTLYTEDVYESNPEYAGQLGSGLVNPLLALEGVTYSQPGDVGDADSNGDYSDYELEPGPHTQG